MKAGSVFEILAASAAKLVTHETAADGLDDFVLDVAAGLDVAAVGLMTRGRHGEPELVSATSDEAADLELLQVARSAGPCIDCLTTGVISSSAGEQFAHRWPDLARRMAALGLYGVTCVPLIANDTVVGSLDIYLAEAAELEVDARDAAKSFAALATLALSSVGSTDRIAGRVVSALNSLVVTEQAVGFVMDRHGVTAPGALAELRALAMQRHLPVALVARQLLEDHPRP